MECKVWSVKCGVCSVQWVKCGVWSVDCRVWSIKCYYEGSTARHPKTAGFAALVLELRISRKEEIHRFPHGACRAARGTRLPEMPQV